MATDQNTPGGAAGNAPPVGFCGKIGLWPFFPKIVGGAPPRHSPRPRAEPSPSYRTQLCCRKVNGRMSESTVPASINTPWKPRLAWVRRCAPAKEHPKNPQKQVKNGCQSDVQNRSKMGQAMEGPRPRVERTRVRGNQNLRACRVRWGDAVLSPNINVNYVQRCGECFCLGVVNKAKNCRAGGLDTLRGLSYMAPPYIREARGKRG